MASIIARLIHILEDAIFPRRCCHCDGIYTIVRNKFEGEPDAPARLGNYLCRSCIGLAQKITSPICVTCGRSFATDHGVDHNCPQCETAVYHFDSARAAVGYATAMRRIIQAYKYQGWVHLAGPLGDMLWEAFISHWGLDQIDVVIPIPLHRRRLRQRGFNQSAQLLRQWPKETGKICADAVCVEIMPEVLARNRATKPQIGMNADARKANMKDAFFLRDASVVRSTRVLLVDDVLTTGATADACAKVLKQAGAASVDVLTLARAV